MVQSENSNPHLENLCRVCSSHKQAFDTQYILKFDGEKMGGFQAIFGVVL